MTTPLYIADYNYPLPDERIAKYPLAERDHSKLLIYRAGQVSEDRFYNIGDYITPESLLIYNNTRVIQARLEFHKPTGARIEVFCLEPLEPHDYQLSLSSVLRFKYGGIGSSPIASKISANETFASSHSKRTANVLPSVSCLNARSVHSPAFSSMASVCHFLALPTIHFQMQPVVEESESW